MSSLLQSSSAGLREERAFGYTSMIFPSEGVFLYTIYLI